MLLPLPRCTAAWLLIAADTSDGAAQPVLLSQSLLSVSLLCVLCAVPIAYARCAVAAVRMIRRLTGCLRDVVQMVLELAASAPRRKMGRCLQKSEVRAWQ